MQVSCLDKVYMVSVMVMNCFLPVSLSYKWFFSDVFYNLIFTIYYLWNSYRDMSYGGASIVGRINFFLLLKHPRAWFTKVDDIMTFLFAFYYKKWLVNIAYSLDPEKLQF